MEGLEVTTAPAVTPTAVLAAAPVADPAAVATPASQEQGQPASQTPEPSGSKENPVVVPRGTQEKFKELEAGGYKAEDIQAYLDTIKDESVRQLVKDSLDGKQVYLKEGGIDLETVDPFDPEELKDLDALVKDPELVAARIQKMQDEYLKLADELDQAKNSVPEPMQRILQHPMVKLAVEEMGRGESFVPKIFDGEAFSDYMKEAISSGNPAAAIEMIEQVPQAIEQIVASSVAAAIERIEQENKAEIQRIEMRTELDSAFSKVASRPEFQSKEPEMVDGAPNLKHPGVAFADWLITGLDNGSLTLQAIKYQGGMEQVAMNWLASQRGGIGKMIHDNTTKQVETFREKVLRSRNAALAAGKAATLSVPTGGVVAPLLHGVDIDLAMRNTPEGHRYAAGIANSKNLTASQISEISAEIKRRSGEA